MVDHERAGVSKTEWREATASCHELRVARVIPETHDSVSIVLAIPDALKKTFAYRAGQFLTFKIPYRGKLLSRSYSLASSPDANTEHKITVKRVDDGRVSNWMNDVVRERTRLMAVPPAGLFLLDPDSTRDALFYSGGSGITPCISIIKSTLATTSRRLELVYANRDARSVIFRDEIEALRVKHADRLTVTHSLDDTQGFLTAGDVSRHLGTSLDRDVYLCGPAAFMDTVEKALLERGVARERIFIERFISPPDPGSEQATRTAAATLGEQTAPSAITIALDGQTHEVPYEAGERILHAAQRAGLDPPFSCQEGYCSCCMAKLTEGQVSMANNDCLSPELLGEGWVLTCQSRCISEVVRIEYRD